AMGRIWTLKAGLRMTYAHPWGGVGAGSFIPQFASYAPLEAPPGMAPHNSFVQVMAENGIFALAAFVTALACAVAASARAARAAPHLGAAAAGLQAALLGFVLSSMTGGIALSWPLYWVLGLSAALPRIAEKEGSTLRIGVPAEAHGF